MRWCVVLGAAAVATVLAMAVPGGAAQGLDVITTHGPVQGLLDDELQIRSFLGIPYGAADIQNRFKAPREPEPWNETLETKQFTKVCPQYVNQEFVGEEDCLVLNVFAPAVTAVEGVEGVEVEEVEEVPLPVLVHVHGGGLQSGSASPDVYGPQRLVPRGVVLVVPNYRLGPLGFLCLRERLAPGNAGLKDLALALRWVRDNIRAFGGDPERVTVSGEGAGAAAAGLLVLSPAADGLAARLIAESGSALSPRALDREPEARARELAAALQALAGRARDGTLDVLLEADASTIVGAAALSGDAYRPCVDVAAGDSEAFLPVAPYRLMRRERNATVALMVGSADGAGMREAAAQTAASLAALDADPAGLLPDDLAFGSAAARDAAARSVKAQYFGDAPLGEGELQQYLRYSTDAHHLGPALRAARLAAAAAAAADDVYFYEFGYEGELNYGRRALAGAGLGAAAAGLAGAARGDTVGYVFVQADGPQDISAEDERVADLLADLWTSFIRNGTPTTATEPQVTWSPLTPEEEHYLNVTAVTAAGSGVRRERLALWDELYAAHYVDCASAAAAGPAGAAAVLLALAALVR